MPRSRAIIAMSLLTIAVTASPADGLQGQPSAGGSDRERPTGREVVVLVHGLGRTPLSMLPLEWALEDAGYEVLNWGYSSICCSVRTLARQLAHDLENDLGSDLERVHFVGHSLGNVIIRSMLVHHQPPQLGRVVMLAPPNQGSELADRYEPSLGWLLTPLADLTTDPTSAAVALKLPANVDVGVIAGRHDGKVSFAESHLEGQREHVVVPSAHTFIMVGDEVHGLVVSFLRHGTFGAAGGKR